MNISPEGQQMVEGFEDLRLMPYRDIAGVLTVGYGHTGPDVKEGVEWTPEQAACQLLADLTTAENGVEAAITKPMQQCQFDSMVSLAFNIGVTAFRKSSVARLFNLGDVAGAAVAFLLWCKAGGKFSEGLANRRTVESQFFLGKSLAEAQAAAHPAQAITDDFNKGERDADR